LRRVAKIFARFLDESLDAECAKAIEDHLAACSLCTAEVASLTECQRLVSGLPLVEPPVNFTTRVMAEVRETAHPPKLWERFFLPLRVKIPLQATAVVLIAVLASYIYQKEHAQVESVVAVQPGSSSKQHEETDNLAPSIAEAPTARSATKQVAKETKAQVQEFKDSAQLKKTQQSSKAEEQQKPIAGKQLVAPEGSGSQEQIRSPAALSPTPLQEEPSATSEPIFPRAEQYSTPAQGKEAAPMPKPEKENASKDAAASGKPFLVPEERRQEGRATSSLSPMQAGSVVGAALPADYELAIRLKEPDRDDKTAVDRLASGDSQSERRSLTSPEEAKKLDQARQQAIQTGQSQTIWVTISRNQYEPLKKELADLGNIQAESSPPERKNNAAAKSSDRLRIKVILLPPLPSEPSNR
jgi:hypothetical protein